MQSPTWSSCLNIWKADDAERKQTFIYFFFRMGKKFRGDVNKSDQSPREKIKIF